MKPRYLAIALVVAGVLVAGVMLLLTPEDDAATPGGAAAEQERGPDGLPTFHADLGEARPAEPITVPASEPGTEPSGDGTGHKSDPNLRRLSGRVLRASDGSALPEAMVSVGWSAFGEPEAATITDQAGRFDLDVSTTQTQVDITLKEAWPQRSQSYPVQPGQDDVTDLELVFDSGFTITGVVLDESGHRLAGGLVDVSSVVEAHTDDLGNFEVRDIAPQEGVAAVRVSAKAPGHAQATLPVRVPADSSQRVFVELRLPVGGAIAGRVTDSRGTPLEGVKASVEFVMTSDHGEQAQRGLAGTSDADGDYLIDSVPEGRYVVEVGYGAGLARSGGEVPDGFEVALDLPSLTPSGSPADSNLPMGARIAKQLAAAKGLALRWFPEVVVQAGQTTRLDVELFPPGAVSGRVLDEHGAPVVDAHVSLERIERWPSVGLSGSTITSTTGLVITSRGEDGKGETELAELEGEARTDERGAFEFGGLMDGEKRLGVTSTGLVSQSRALDLKPGQVRAGEDFVLERGLSIRGRLRDETGAPIEGASVEAAPLGENAFIGGELTTDAEGRFEIGGLPPGPRRLLVFKPGFKSLQTHVSPGGSELELTMEPAPKVIGIVTNGVQGGPITNFDVSISYEGSSWTNSGGNYPDGRFEMPIDSDTPCTVTVRSGGFRDVVLKDVLPSRTALDPLQIRLLPE